MPSPRALLSLALLAPLSACALQKNASSTVLRSEDFIADPTATPTTPRPATAASTPVGAEEITLRPAPSSAADPLARPAAPAPAQPATISPPLPQPSALSAQDDAFDLQAIPGPPVLAEPAPAPATEPILIDAKLGELNGRPVRVREMLDAVGFRLQQAATRRRLERVDWQLARLTPHDREISREEWLAFARAAFANELNGILEDELLQAEARASLKPEQQQGLRYLVQEFGQQERRKYGGSQAEYARSLREGGDAKTVEQARREREAALLVGYQLDEKIRKRIRVSWKDVRLWYERNFEVFNPPAKATFRMIQVAPDNPEALARVESALKAGQPFEQVAQSEDNRQNRDKGGLWGEYEFKGEFKDATLFSEPLNAAAVSLSPGRWTGPIDFAGTKAFLYLEKIDQVSQPLSSPEVQLGIANLLNERAFLVEKDKYLDRLKSRASYSPIDDMAQRLTEIAAERYWPRN